MNVIKRSVVVVGLSVMLLLLFSACELLSAGLGARVDMQGPVVTISSPDFMENVQNEITVSGTVHDDVSVATLKVTIEGINSEWFNDSGVWLYRASSAESWQDYSAGTWVSDADGHIQWSVDITLGAVAEGQFIVNVRATDSSENSDANSYQQRVLVYDNTPPAVSLISPSLEAGTSEQLFPDFDAYQLQTFSILDKLYNGDIALRWSIQDQSLDRMLIQLTDEAGAVFYENMVTDLKRNDSILIPASELLNPENSTPLADKTYIQVLTHCYDASDNLESKSHGWFVYWPQSNIPWLDNPVSESDPDDRRIYPGFRIQGTAYDDSAVASVSLTLYQGQGTSGLVERGPVLQEYPEDVQSRSAVWGFDAPEETGVYTLEATCTDAGGTESTTIIGYFSIEDISVPNIDISGPDAILPLFGDANGDVIFEGQADDDSDILSVKLVWINPQTNFDTSLLSYMESSYTEWANAAAPYTDAQGNKVWTLSLGERQVLESGRRARAFSQTINLFSDMGINAAMPLSNQTFVVRAEDDNGKVRMEQYTTTGDTNPPSLAVTAVSVDRDGTVSEHVIAANLVLSAFSSEDTVQLSGTWNDDSFVVWEDVSKIGSFNLSWGNTAATAQLYADGTWRSNWFTPPGGAVASVHASLRDWGGNSASDTVSFLVETDNPQLLRVSSTQQDGSWAAGETIQIYLDFNKNVSFSSASSSLDPVLVLNNGANAEYLSGNGTARHVYQYQIAISEDIEDLDVSTITLNENEWQDQSGRLVDMQLPTGINSLGGGKNLRIDTIAPSIATLTAVSAAGYYSENSVIYIAVDLSETVNCNGNPRLRLATSPETFAEFENMVGPSRILFSYEVAAEQNANPLSVVSFELNGASVQDLAENSLGLTLPAGGLLDKTIVIDTTAPDAPIISGISAGTKYSTQGFTLQGLEVGAYAEYSVDGGTSWQEYTGAVSVSINGSYTITARQRDLAGNFSTQTAAVGPVIIDNGALLVRTSSSTADGIYTEGDSIAITLHFRKPVWLLSGTPQVELTTDALVEYSSGSGTNTLVFLYTVAAGEEAALLDIQSLDMSGCALRDAASGGTDIGSLLELPASGSGDSLAEQKNIQIIAGVPVLQSVSLSGTSLSLVFDRSVYKGAGSLRLAQEATGYRIPAILTQSEYENLHNAADGAGESLLEAHYLYGTNGANEAGVSDTTGKYVLSFETETNDAALLALFQSLDAHAVEIPVWSSATQISGSTVTVQLLGSFALPVLGASYEITVPEGYVQDILSSENAQDTGRSIASLGVEAPVIRIRKQKEALALDTGIVRATQPLSAAVKMDCQTPGAEIRYELSNLIATPEAIANPNTPNLPPTAGVNPALPAEPTNDPATGSPVYTAQFDIGDSGNTEDGLKYRLRARAFVGSGSSSVGSESSHEIAYRSVLRFYNDATVALHDYDPTREEQVWVRGGDASSGSVLTPAFPLSWSNTEYDKIRLMTDEGGNSWYWVSWELNTTAYVALILGTTPDTVEDAANGPLIWGWGKNAWVPFKEYYPVFPGESRTLQSSLYATIDGVGRGAFMFATEADGGLNNR